MSVLPAEGTDNPGELGENEMIRQAEETRHWLEKRPYIRNRNLWILFLTALTIKLALVVYLSSLAISAAPDRAHGRISVTAGDTDSYLGAVENFALTGEYYFWNGVEKVYAGRTPHYGIPYYLFL